MVTLTGARFGLIDDYGSISFYGAFKRDFNGPFFKYLHGVER